MQLDLSELTQAVTEREIKRAYAKLLKTHRPDTDPEAFQCLRQAYEHALEEVRRPDWLEGDEDGPAEEPAVPPVEGAPTAPASIDQPGMADTAVVPRALQPAAGAPETHSRVAALLKDDLDEGWETARREGIDSAFQLQLLQHCLASRDLQSLNWARTNLHWLTLAQPSYLQAREAMLLAEQVTGEVMGLVEQLLAQGQEIEAYRQLSAEMDSEWLKPLDRRSQFQARLFDLLEESWDWTPAFFDRICALCGWNDGRGHLPCSAGRWVALDDRCHAYALEATVREQLAQPAETAHQRAGWFLLGDLDDRRRRQWADRFTPDDWQACADLEHGIARCPTLPAMLERDYFTGWRAWMPRGYWGWGYLYVWALLSCAICLTTALDPRKASFDTGFLFFAPLLMLALVAIPGYWLMRVWTLISRAATNVDVRLSAWLLPKWMTRRGSGVLVLRHIFPSLLPASLVYVWGRELPLLGPALALGTVAGAVQFANVITQGRSPAPWAERGVQGVVKMLNNRRLIKQVMVLVGGLIVMTVFNLIFR